MVARRGAGPPSVGLVFNLAQRSTSAHPRCAALMREAMQGDPDGLLASFELCLMHILAADKKDAAMGRAQRFAVDFVAGLCRENAETDDSPAEEVLAATVRLALGAVESADRAVRTRACEMAVSVIRRLPEGNALDPDLCDEYCEAMTQRLRDKLPALRAAAVTALGWFVDPSDREGKATMRTMLQMLAGDASRDVRRAVVGALPVCDEVVAALLTRTRDASDAVREAVFCALRDRVPPKALSIAQRVEALGRGLAERAASVRAAADGMLAAWLQGPECEGDVERLLDLLDAELNEEVAMAALDALMRAGTLDPREAARQARDGERGMRVPAPALLTAGQALLWRAVAERLAGAAARRGAGAAAGSGHAAAVEAAAAGEDLDALEAALPATVVEMVGLVERHWAAGPEHRCAARQLALVAARCLDFADAAGRAAAAEVVAGLLAEPPAPGEGGAAASVGCGGDGRWEDAVAELASRVHGTGAALAQCLCDAASACSRAWAPPAVSPAEAAAQLLALTARLARRMTTARGAGACAAGEVTVEVLYNQVVVANLNHECQIVRQHAVEALGALLLLDGVPGGQREHTAMLRFMLADGSSARAVQAEAARALGDLCLVRAPGEVDAAGAEMLGLLVEEGGRAGAGVVEKTTVRALADTMMEALDAAAPAPARPTRRGKAGKAAGVAADASDAAEGGAGSLAVACAEALCRVCVHDPLFRAARAGAAPAEGDVRGAVARLCVAGVDPAAPERLQQMVPGFLRTFAVSAPSSHRLLAAAVPVAARRALSRASTASHTPALVKMLGGVLGEAAVHLEGGAEGLGHEGLALWMLHEIGACPPVTPAKPYSAALCKALGALHVKGAALTPAAAAALRIAAAKAEHAVQDKGSAKDLSAFSDRLAGEAGAAGLAGAEVADAEVAAMEERLRHMPGSAGEDLDPLPFDDAATGNARGRRAATTRAGRYAESESEDESSEGEEEGESEEEGGRAGMRRVAWRGSGKGQRAAEAAHENEGEGSEGLGAGEESGNEAAARKGRGKGTAKGRGGARAMRPAAVHAQAAGHAQEAAVEEGKENEEEGRVGKRGAARGKAGEGVARRTRGALRENV